MDFNTDRLNELPLETLWKIAFKTLNAIDAQCAKRRAERAAAASNDRRWFAFYAQMFHKIDWRLIHSIFKIN